MTVSGSSVWPATCWLSWAMPETPAPFIVGASRSGTTLLRLMLDAHPDLAIPPETEFILQVADVADLANGDNAHAACAFVSTLTSHRRWPDFHLDRDALESRVAALQPWNAGDALRSFYPSVRSALRQTALGRQDAWLRQAHPRGA